MKYLLYIIIGLGIVALLFLVYINREQPQLSNNQPTAQSLNTAEGNWESRTDDQPPVAITVTPIEFGTGVEKWKFQIAFDTHSGSLDDDLLAVASLVDDAGNVYQPMAWDGPGPGGHHREGILVFAALNPAPSYVELKIKNAGGVPERLFKWELK